MARLLRRLLLTVALFFLAPIPGSVIADSIGSLSLDSLGSEEREVIEHTLAAIDAGGPFAYHQDGAVFSNREGLLPTEPRGYYHEYTVPTPGASDRGARRIVTGTAGEAYYTDDHYSSFRRLR